jgi:hypothetical protein
VRKTLLATAVAAALTLGAADASAQTKGAATKADMQAIQAQMQALADRLNKLEAANAQLQTENAELKALVDRRDAETDYLKAQTKDLREESAVTANEVAKVKGADWASRIKLKGDLRVRDENISQDRLVADGTGAAVDDAPDRNRVRVRARFGLEAKVTDTVTLGAQIASGSDRDPRSTNQTFTEDAAKKDIWLDLAYVDWKFMNGGTLSLGKMKQPYWRPGQSLFFDNDVNPEGIAVSFDRGLLFGSAYAFSMWENSSSNPANVTEDTVLWGTQAGLKFPLLGGETRVALHYYDLNGGQGFNPFALCSANGNTTVSTTSPPGTTAIPVQVLLYDYDVLMASAEMGLTLAGLPFSVWVDYAQNLADDVQDDTAFAVGTTLGKASNARTWEVGLFYQDMEKDALFAQWIDSDFADGITDAEGFVLKAGYAPVKNVTLNGTYFLNTRTVCGTGTAPSNRQCGSGIPEYELDYDRWQLDVNYKF